jgi:hypothetical protein
MRCSTFVIVALSASGTIASSCWDQHSYKTDLELTVDMSNSEKALGSRTIFLNNERQEQPPSSSRGPFKTVNIKVGKDRENKDIRCKLLDNDGKPIKAARGPNNIQETFADTGKGEWTFIQESEVSSIVCDPAFQKAT